MKDFRCGAPIYNGTGKGQIHLIDTMKLRPKHACAAKPEGEEVEFWARGVADPPTGMQGIECGLPLPYKLPPDLYEGDDIPWMVAEPWPGPDSQGRHIFEPAPSHYGRLEDD